MCKMFILISIPFVIRAPSYPKLETNPKFRCFLVLPLAITDELLLRIPRTYYDQYLLITIKIDPLLRRNLFEGVLAIIKIRPLHR